MAAEMLLHALMSNMFATGLLDDLFLELVVVQDGNNPDFIAEIVTLFCEEGERFIREIAKLLDKPGVDFDKVDDLARQLMESSASVGAQRLKNTCMQFREFCEERSRDRCLLMLDAVRNDFYDLGSNFETMLQLQQLI